MKWVFKFLLLNSVMLIMFVGADCLAWTAVYNGLKPMEWVCAQHSGALYNVTIGARYDLVRRVLWIRALYQMGSAYVYPRAGTSQTTNTPLLVFALTVGLNLWLVSKMEQELGMPRLESARDLKPELSEAND